MSKGTCDNSKRLLIDFDRTVHRYRKGWFDGTIYDEPIEGAIEALKALQKSGYKIIIFTTLSALGESRNREIHDWLLTYGLDLEVTNTKVPARAIIDDRAIRFEGNWRSVLNYFI